ncbi:MAG: tetratricopeptide repeat protein [Bacteroidales bacterium]|nr:tetratricopeptide repeat protein [Bacteroidales bacterium]
MKRFSKYLILVLFLVSAATVSGQSDEKTIRRGNRNYKSGNYDQAIARYREALEIRPNNAKAQFNLGDAYYAKQSYDTAYTEFQKAVEMSPDAKLKSDAVYNMGNCLLVQDKFYDAFNLYKVSLKLNPDNANALYNLEYCRAHLVKSKVFVVQPEHGRVEAKEKEAFNGQQVTLTSKADSDYALSQYVVVRADNPEVQVQVNGGSFIMPKFDVKVTAEFKQAHRIDIDPNIKNGTVRADRQKAVEGQQVNLEAQGENDWVLDKFTVYRTGNRNDTVPVNKTTFKMPDFDVTVTATFRSALRVNVDSVANGKITVTDSLVKPGDNVGIIVKPGKGYQLGDLRVVSDRDATESAPVSDDNLFQMLDTDVTVKANFVEATDYYKVTADTTLKGGHVLLEQSEATRRETVKLDNAPEPGYQFKEYVIHQVGDTTVKVQPLGNYFTMPDFDVEVSAIFEKSEGEDQQQQDQQQDQQDQQNQEQQQDQQSQDQQQQQQNQQQQNQQMSKEDAQRMLDALENQEKKTMEKVNEQKVRQQPKKRSDKDW